VSNNVLPKNVLLCPPTQYDLRYAINPWMLGQQVDKIKAVEEFDAIVEAYKTLGLKPQFIEQDDALPDMVFTANAGVMIGDIFIPSNFRYVERQGESKLFADYFERVGIKVEYIDESIIFEGAGDALFLGDTLVLGYGFRSMQETKTALLKYLPEDKILSLGLSNPYFYHLDTCFSPLPSGKFIYYPDAFDDQSRKLLEQLGGYWVTEDFCINYGCNMVAYGDTMLTSYVDERIQEIADLENLKIVQLPINEFIKAGGGVRCLSFPY